MKKFASAGLPAAIAVTMAVVLGVSALGQEKAKTETPAREMSVSRALVGTGVENQELVGSAETFPASTEKVYCFIEVTNITKDTEVSFIWYHGDKEMRKFNLPLKAGPKWRTWSYKNIGGQKGDWKVEVKDVEGKLLKDAKFKVE